MNLTPGQSQWIQFNQHFDVVPDQSDWDLSYSLPGAKGQPCRENFRPRNCGLTERNIANSLRKRHGVYLIGFDRKIIYVGYACGQDFFARLKTHRIKLTGSAHNPGISHCALHRKFVVDRYRKMPTLVRSDTLDGFWLSTYELHQCTTAGRKKKGECCAHEQLEAELYFAVQKKQGTAPKLNDPSKICSNYYQMGVQLNLPPS